MIEAFTTHFQSQTITTTVDGVSSDIIVPEPVRKNRTLLSLTTNATSSFISFAAGRNCRLSDDTTAVIAEVSGYPLLSRSRQGNKTVIDARITPIISIAEDKMLATLSLYPHLPGTVALTLSDILALCREQDVSCGIDEIIIQQTIEQVEQFGQPLQEIPIARGLLPVDGKDSYLRFEVEIGPFPGKILQDGSIDWRHRKIFIGINKDELIATKVPLTPGTPGTDIHCFPIPQKPGKDISVKVAGDVQYSEQTNSCHPHFS